MPHYQHLGAVPKHRHTFFKDTDGNILYEELMGEEGFSSDSSLLYHKHIPSGIVGSRVWDLPDQSLTPNHPLLPRHLTLHDLGRAADPAAVDAVTGRRLVMGNGDVRLSYAWAGRTSPLYKNALGDECVFVEKGNATVETQFGALPVEEGDYVVIPRATIHRWVVPEGNVVQLFFIEANSHIAPPKRYLSKYGQLLEHSPYCERDLHGPAEPLLVEGGNVEVFIKHRGAGPTGVVGTVHMLPNHPFDVVGWDGCLYPFTFNIRDYMPITGKLHQPPPVHQVFEGHNFVICNFLPRKVDYHELAVPVPYYHSNVDSDEVMFYVAGDYEARKGSGINKGSISIHPGGHPHGPQPGAVEASVGVERFDETAVMVDTFLPLQLGEAGMASDDGRYAESWTPGHQWTGGKWGNP